MSDRACPQSMGRSRTNQSGEKNIRAIESSEPFSWGCRLTFWALPQADEALIPLRIKPMNFGSFSKTQLRRQRQVMREITIRIGYTWDESVRDGECKEAGIEVDDEQADLPKEAAARTVQNTPARKRPVPRTKPG